MVVLLYGWSDIIGMFNCLRPPTSLRHDAASTSTSASPPSPLSVMNYSSVCCWRQVAGWLQRLLPLHCCCCLISSTNSKLVTAPQGLVSLLLAQHYYSSTTQGRLQHTTLTKQIHAAQMHKNICRQPVKYLNTKKYFCGRPLTLKVRPVRPCGSPGGEPWCNGSPRPATGLLGLVEATPGTDLDIQDKPTTIAPWLSPHSAAGGSCVCAGPWLVTRVTRDT